MASPSCRPVLVHGSLLSAGSPAFSQWNLVLSASTTVLVLKKQASACTREGPRLGSSHVCPEATWALLLPSFPPR